MVNVVIMGVCGRMGRENIVVFFEDKDIKIVGAVDFSRYIDSDMKMQNIYLSIDDNQWIEKKSKTHGIEDIITNSPKMIIIKDKIERVSKTNSAVIIYGKTGTGKELVAQAIHSRSIRKNKPFVSQNCAAIPSSLY